MFLLLDVIRELLFAIYIKKSSIFKTLNKRRGNALLLNKNNYCQKTTVHREKNVIKKKLHKTKYLEKRPSDFTPQIDHL